MKTIDYERLKAESNERIEQARRDMKFSERFGRATLYWCLFWYFIFLIFAVMWVAAQINIATM